MSVVEEVGDYNYGPGHPMKPHRIRMTHDLLVNYDIYKHLIIYVPPKFTMPNIYTYIYLYLPPFEWCRVETASSHCKGNVLVPCG